MRTAAIIMGAAALDHWGVPEIEDGFIVALLIGGMVTAIAADIREAIGL